MSFADHIRACNNFDPARVVPLLAGERPDRLAAARQCRGAAAVSRRCSRSRASGAAGCRGGCRHGQRRGRRGGRGAGRREPACRNGATRPSTSMPRWGDPPIFRLDRGAVPFFGMRAYGVHLNGYRRDGGRLHLWVGRRAPDKRVAPEQARQHRRRRHRQRPRHRRDLVQGGRGGGRHPGGAGRRAVPVGAVSYRMETELGIRDDVLFVYDLEMPADFVPHNSDGEIVAFRADAGRPRSSSGCARPTTSSSTSIW